MKHFFAAFLFLAVLTACSSPQSQSDPVRLPRLEVNGTYLMNDQGDTVQLRGVSYGWHNLWPRFYNAESVRYLVKEWHATVLRASMGIGINELSYLVNPDYAKERITTVVDAAIEQGVYVLIDWHSHTLELEPAVQFFTEMATRYKGVPNVIYEIFNEPVEQSWSEVKAYSEKVIRAIRSVEPESVILVGCPHWDQDIHLVAQDPIVGEKNLMYTVHFYAGTHKEWLRQASDYALSKGVPIFVSECAAMNADGDGPLDVEEWQRWIDWMDAHRISWVAWSISDKHETCSMLLPSAASEGGWQEFEIKEWGQMVRRYLLPNVQ